MKQLNFVPASIARRAEQGRLIAACVIAALLGAAAAGASGLMLRTETAAAESRLAAAQERSAALAAVSPADADLAARISKLNALASADTDWSRAFTLAESSVPADIVLGSYAYSTVANAFLLKMAGTAPSNVSFAAFDESLRKNPAFSAVKVESYSYLASKGTVTFSVSVAVKRDQVSYK